MWKFESQRAIIRFQKLYFKMTRQKSRHKLGITIPIKMEKDFFEEVMTTIS